MACAVVLGTTVVAIVSVAPAAVEKAKPAPASVSVSAATPAPAKAEAAKPAEIRVFPPDVQLTTARDRQ